MLSSLIHCEDDDAPSHATYDHKASDPRYDATQYEIRGRRLDNMPMSAWIAGR
jgi:hypothetical protein